MNWRFRPRTCVGDDGFALQPPDETRSGSSEGLAWCEMARGPLLHWVRLEGTGGGEPRVAAVHVLAPTEGNFHPCGAFARLLSGLPRQVSPARIELLGAAFDPCVRLAVEPASGLPQDACTT